MRRSPRRAHVYLMERAVRRQLRRFQELKARRAADLRDIVRLVHGDGKSSVRVHANGDRAIRSCCSLQWRMPKNDKPQPGLRHRIEHCSIVNDEIVERIQWRLGAMVTPFGSYVYYHGAKTARLGTGRSESSACSRIAHSIDRRIVVAGASWIAPVVRISRFCAMQSCVTRTGFDGAPIGHLSQRISAEEALALYRATRHTPPRKTIAKARCFPVI